MKKTIITMLIALVAMVASAETYNYLKFTKTNGSTVTCSVEGLKVTYVTDTRPIDRIAAEAEGADLFIAEGMYGEAEKDDALREKKHMLMQDACRLAKEAGAKELWLTHFSPALNRPDEFVDVARAIFPNTKTGTDGMSLTLKFEEE